MGSDCPQKPAIPIIFALILPSFWSLPGSGLKWGLEISRREGTLPEGKRTWLCQEIKGLSLHTKPLLFNQS